MKFVSVPHKEKVKRAWTDEYIELTYDEARYLLSKWKEAVRYNMTLDYSYAHGIDEILYRPAGFETMARMRVRVLAPGAEDEQQE